jgi:hypothetical protein
MKARVGNNIMQFSSLEGKAIEIEFCQIFWVDSPSSTIDNLIVATKMFFFNNKRVQKVSQFKPPKCALFTPIPKNNSIAIVVLYISGKKWLHHFK